MKTAVNQIKSTHNTMLSQIYIAALAIAVVAGLAPLSAQAASDAWDGSTDGVWATSANWLTDPVTVPGTGDAATFNGAGNGFTTINLGGGVTINTVLFDTASAAAYTIGSGAVGSQTLSLDNAGSIALNLGVANSQLFNANINLSTAANATATIRNSSSSALTIAGAVNSVPAAGNSLLTVTNSSAITISGAVTETGAGNNALLKAGTGTLTLSGGSTWSGSGAIGYVPGPTGYPLVAREGTLLLNGGTHTVSGELVIGGVVANGGAGQNAKIIVDGSTLNVSSWFSVGRGNGVGGVSSDLVLTNAAVATAANLSAGFNAAAGNLPKGSMTLNNSSTFTVTGNGAVNIAESPGSDITVTLNNSAQFIAAGTAIKFLGQTGKGTINLNGSSSMLLGNGITYVGYRTGTGVVSVAGSAVLSVGNDFRVGGSDLSGTGINGYGTVNQSGGLINLSSLTVARGNNNQNGVSGEINISGGTLTSTNDVVLGYAGANNLGKVTINGGTMKVASTATKWLQLGVFDTAKGQIDINSGALNLNASTAIKFTPGNTGSSGNANVINQNGGTVTFYSDDSTTVGGTGDIDLARSGSASANNTYNLNGGTLTVPRIFCNTTLPTRAFNFNGGTLKPTASSAIFLNLGTGNARANVRNNGAIIDTDGKDITIAQALLHSNIGGDAATDGGLIKTNTGTLTLTGASTYTGDTTIKGGTLALGTGGSLTSPNIIVNGGTIFDVSGITYTMSANQTLKGTGNINGNVATASGTSSIAPGTSAGTLTFNNNLNMSAGGKATFELSTVYNSGNDLVVVTGDLALSSSDTIYIDALSDAADLDTNSPYVLFAVSGTTTMATTPALQWVGTQPGNYLNFSIALSGNNVVLQYTPATAPTVSAVADTASATRNQNVTITAEVTPGSGSIVSVTADLTQIGGSASASLVVSNGNVYTNTFTVAASVSTGAKTIPVTATDDTTPTPLNGNDVINLTINVANQVWDGGAGDDNWSSNPNWLSDAGPGLSGDSVSFAGSVNTSPDMDASYSVTGVAFDSGASSFTVGTSSSTLTLASGTGVVNNSANAQTLNVPITMGAAQTFNAASGDLSLGGNIANGGNLLTVSGGFNTSIGGSVSGSGGFTKTGSGSATINGDITSTGLVQFNGGTSTVSGDISPGGSEVWVAEGSGSTATLNVETGSTVTVNNWLPIGRNSGNGTLNINGGTVVHTGGGNLTLSTLGSGATGTLNLHSGAISNQSGGTYLGENSNGTGNYNQYGGVAELGTFLSMGNINSVGRAMVSNGVANVNGTIEVGFGDNNTRVGTSTLTIENGGVVNASGFVRLAFAGSATKIGIITNNGGTLNVGATALYMGYWDPTSSSVVQNSGNIKLNNNSEIRVAENNNSSGTHTFNHNGGNVTFYSDAGTTVGGTGSLNLMNSGTGAGIYNLNGGTLTVPQIRKAGGSGTATFNFNGGTLKPTASSATFLQGLTAANVQAGGAVIDTDSQSITIGQALLAAGGGLTKNSAGTLTLSGANTYAGNTTINGGTLALSGSGSIGSSPIITLASGAILDVSGVSFILAAGQTLKGNGTVTGAATLDGTVAAGTSIGTLTFNNPAFVNGTIEAEIASGPSADLINFVGGATLNSGSTLTVISTGGIANGETFNLFDGSLSGTFTTLNLPGGTLHWYTANLYSNGEIIFYNTPPAAANFDLGVASGGSTTATVPGKFASDNNGDTVTVVAVTQGANGTVTFSGTSVTYVNTSAAASDTFTYTVSDGFTTSTATVTVTITSPQGSNLVSGPTDIGGGQYQIGYLGVPGKDYALDETASLAPPITWTPVVTNTAAANGAITYTVTPSFYPSGYFRTRHVP